MMAMIIAPPTPTTTPTTILLVVDKPLVEEFLLLSLVEGVGADEVITEVWVMITVEPLSIELKVVKLSLGALVVGGAVVVGEEVVATAEEVESVEEVEGVEAGEEEDSVEEVEEVLGDDEVVLLDEAELLESGEAVELAAVEVVLDEVEVDDDDDDEDEVEVDDEVEVGEVDDGVDLVEVELVLVGNDTKLGEVVNGIEEKSVRTESPLNPELVELVAESALSFKTNSVEAAAATEVIEKRTSLLWTC